MSHMKIKKKNAKSGLNIFKVLRLAKICSWK